MMLAYFGRRYVNLLRMAGFAWHLYPEMASKPHLSNEVGGAISLYRHWCAEGMRPAEGPGERIAA